MCLNGILTYIVFIVVIHEDIVPDTVAQPAGETYEHDTCWDSGIGTACHVSNISLKRSNVCRKVL